MPAIVVAPSASASPAAPRAAVPGGRLAALAPLGADVPGDLAVVGFDNIPESRFFWPALTTVDQPLIDLKMKTKRLDIFN